MTRTLVTALAVLTFAVMGQSGVRAQTGTGSGDQYGSSSSGSATGSTSGAGMSGSSETTSGATTDPSTTPSTTTTTTTTSSTTHSSMPATAGPWPSLLLMGFGALGGGTLLKRVRR
ncbi:MAG: hypothetical protein U0167_10280 [bacterium]